MHEVRLLSDLPEPFARLYDHETKRYFTPLDSRGIADVDAVFELAIRTYPGSLPDFNRSERNKHHLYWTVDWWKQFAAIQLTPADRSTVSEFRNGTPQKAYVPLPLHRWIEASQIPPPAPSLEVMRRRNNAWASASLLLKSCVELDKARMDYQDRRGKTRQVLGSIAGITPLSRRREEQFKDVVDDEYWLSELGNRLESWRQISDERGDLPVNEGFIATPRLSDVRELRRRTRPGAIIPRLPAFLQAA